MTPADKKRLIRNIVVTMASIPQAHTGTADQAFLQSIRLNEPALQRLGLKTEDIVDRELTTANR